MSYPHDSLGRSSLRSLQSIRTAYSGTSLASHPSYTLNVDRLSLSGLSVAAPSEIVIVQPTGQAAYQHTIDKAISNFFVEFNDFKEVYKPGDTISGTVTMDVWTPLEIRYVEFVLQGRGQVRMFTRHTSTAYKEKPRTETYLDKRIMLLKPRAGALHMTLNPGRYVSKFSYDLPDAIPPSVPQFEMGRGYVFSIAYCAQANVCDSVRSGNIVHSERYVRIVKASRRNFSVIPLHEWQAISGASEPIAHAEQVQLFCAGGSEPTSVLVNLNRGVFPIGDHIKVGVEVYSSNGKKIKNITAELQQKIINKGGRVGKFEHVLITGQDRREDKKPREKADKNMIKSKFSIPLPASVVPSFLPYCELVKISYCMCITVKFKGLGGKMILSLPLTVTPPSNENRHIEENPDLPAFDKPVKQFPYFSKSPKDMFDSNGQTSGASEPESTSRMSNLTLQPALKDTKGKNSNNPEVSAKYKTGWKCCNCCIGCCGVGIYD